MWRSNKHEQCGASQTISFITLHFTTMKITVEINNLKGNLNLHCKQGNILFLCTYRTLTLTYNRDLF